MAKSIKELVQEALEEMIQEQKIEITDSQGEKIEYLEIQVASSEETDDEDFEDVEQDEE